MPDFEEADGHTAPPRGEQRMMQTVPSLSFLFFYSIQDSSPRFGNAIFRLSLSTLINPVRIIPYRNVWRMVA